MPHITTCPRCGKAYEEGSEEQANSPHRTCDPCRLFAYLTGGTVTCPSFRHALERADIETLQRALASLRKKQFKRTAVNAVAARLRRLQKREETA